MKPSIIFTDSNSTIDLSNTLKITDGSRHFQPRVNLIRQCINRGIIQLEFIPTEFNVADILTKNLEKRDYHRHAKKLLEGFKGVKENIFKDV